MSDHPHDKLEEFRRERERLNEKLLGSGHKGIQRFFALDHQAYKDGGSIVIPHLRRASERMEEALEARSK
jgi:hypothetical protein